MTTARALDGLPPYGPMPEQFSATGRGMHREGFVVEFTPTDAAAWVGNFQRGMASLDAVIVSHKNAITVIAGGQASRACVRDFGGQIEQVFELADRVIFSNGLWLEATDGERLLWKTRRLSWDGIIGLQLDGERIVGNAYDPMTDGWTPFSVEVASGETVGGSYPPALS